jgi:hypothetical protein
LEKRAEQVLPESKGGGGKMEGGGKGRRNGPNNVCTYEYMKKEKQNVKKWTCNELNNSSEKNHKKENRSITIIRNFMPKH